MALATIVFGLGRGVYVMDGYRDSPGGAALTRFHDRSEAGRALAAELSHRADLSNALVLALPRGGVPVGFEVAIALGIPLDIYVVRKLGLPGYEELALGAIATGGTIVWNENLKARLQLPENALQQIIRRELVELERREMRYRDGRELPELRDKIVLLVDDGLATGSSMRAAVAGLQQHETRSCIVAVPVAPPHTCEELAELADEVVCLLKPPNFMAVGEFYDDFSQTTDEEVRALLAEVAALH